jgi:ribosome-associated protein
MKKTPSKKTLSAKPAATKKSANTTSTARKKTTTPHPKGKTAPLKKVALKKPAPAKVTRSKPALRSKTPAADREAVMTRLIVKALEDLKGKNIVTLDVKHLTDVMDTLVIVSGTSNRHVKSLADNARMEMKKAGYLHYGMEGEDAGEWVLVDFGGVVLHVMQPHIREFYDLERLWSTPRAERE